ncbi:MAG: cation:proton antiporter [Dehalococcoidales bacterium]|nr:cation:proton antiporter [Dehalococcoidales bacterium]
MTDTSLLLNLVLILTATAIGGVLALRLKQPLIVGYLVAGMIVGPFTPGPQANLETLRLLAEVGVALLLFVMGTSTIPSKLRGLGGVILLGGALQIALTIGLGLLFMPFLGLSLAQGFLLGTILAQSSSAVIARVLDNRRETETVHGRIAVGISLTQDVSSLPLLMLLLVFLGETATTLLSFLLTLGEVFGLAIATFIIGRILWPRLLEWFGRFNSAELTLLSTLALAIGGGLAVQAIGLSFALGAFLAGLVIAESPRRSDALSQILPLRDIFSAIFFVSIGTLFNPTVVWQFPLPLLGLLGALVVGKAVISAVIVKLFHNNRSTAIMSGLLLAQIGEFAFILANIGLEHGAISESLFSIVIAAAIISILVNSLILDSAPPVLEFLARVVRFSPLTKRPTALIASALRRGRTFAQKKGEKKNH